MQAADRARRCVTGCRLVVVVVDEQSLRRLLIIGAKSVIFELYVHAAAQPGTLSGGMLTRKTPIDARAAGIGK
jgi:hypothetical protein